MSAEVTFFSFFFFIFIERNKANDRIGCTKEMLKILSPYCGNCHTNFNKFIYIHIYLFCLSRANKLLLVRLLVTSYNFK